MNNKFLSIKVDNEYININYLGYVHLLKSNDKILIKFVDKHGVHLTSKYYDDFQEAEKVMTELWTETLMPQGFVMFCNIIIKAEDIRTLSPDYLMMLTNSGYIDIGDEAAFNIQKENERKYKREFEAFINQFFDVDHTI